MSTSLYGTPPNQDVSSTNSTSLYGGAATPIPDSSGNLVVRGDLVVLSGNILTTATTGNIFPTNATTVNFAGSATTVNIGAGTGTTTINNNLTVGGTVTGPGADFGNITIAVADDNTITTTTGNLKLGAATNTVQVLNNLTTGGDVTVGDDLTVNGNNVNLAQATVIGVNENNNRLNRITVRSSSGNQTGFRVSGPNTSTASQAIITALSTSDLNNGRAINLLSLASGAADPYRISINTTTGGTIGPATGIIGFYDNLTQFATLNPAGPTLNSDLTTKVYVDAHPGTTYDIDATTTTGGANFNLNGSDSTTDTIKFANGTNVTVAATSANEITISAVNTDTTYDISASTTTGGANFNLNGSDSTTDTVKFAGGTNVTVAATSANEITVSATDTNTTYTIDASSATGGANLNLVGSDSTTDTVKFANGTGVTVTQNTASEIGIAIGQPVATTDSVTFDTVSATTSVDTPQIFGVSGQLDINTTGPGGSLIRLTAAESPPIGSGQLTIDTTGLTFIHNTSLPAPPILVNGTWSFNPSGTTSFPNYTFPYADGTANQVLKTNGSGVLSWQTDTNTTYDFNAATATGGANLNLVGSDSTTDTVKFASGTGVTVSQINANEIGIAIGQAVGTGDSPSFAGVTGGNISVGVATDNTIAATNLNGNIDLTPNGTGIVTVSTATDTNITDANYVTGLIWGTRNTAFSIPTTALTTNTGSNGFQAVSSAGGANGYSAQVGINHYYADTTAGLNSGATLVFRAANGTNSAPTALTTNAVPMTITADGYATTGFAGSIATAGSGGGTTSIQPAQIQFYARENFADSAGTVTNAGMGFRVRGFQNATAMSVANRINFIDHNPTVATYRANTFNVQTATSTTNVINATGASVTFNTTAPGNYIRTGTTNTTMPATNLRYQRTDTTGPNNNDGVSYNLQVAGTTTTATIARIDALYRSSLLHEVGISVSSDSFTADTDRIYIGTAESTTIRSTPAGGGTTSDILTINDTAITARRPLRILTVGGVNYVEFSANTTNNQTYVLPTAYPTTNGQVLTSTTTGTMTWTGSGNTAANYLDANWTTAIGALTANTIYGIPLTSVSGQNITIATGAIAIDNATATGPTRITFSQTGRYNLQFSIQLANADSAEQDFDLWLRKNTVDVADTNTQLTIVKQQGGIPGKNVMALNLLLDVTTAGDYYELVYATTDPDCKPEVIAATTTPYVRPRAPAIIVTVVPVGA